MKTRQGFTLIELLVVISIIALLIGILLPALGAARRTARQIQNSTQLRGIQQGQVIFAQSNKTGSTEGYYAGLEADGDVPSAAGAGGDYGSAGTATVSDAFAVMLNNNAFTPEYIINPTDTAKQEVAISGNVGTGNHSYASIDYDGGASTGLSITGAQLKNEWRETINSQAVVFADRSAAVAGDLTAGTVWTDTGYKGSWVHNDNSTGFEPSQTVAAGDKEYDDNPVDAGELIDSLFMYN